MIPKKEEIKQVSTTPAPKCFTGGDQGFVSLALESVSNINSNTKQFRFKLPESDQVSGLAVASALITKYKGPDMEKPAIRPYTPVSDEGKQMCGPSTSSAINTPPQIFLGTLILSSSPTQMALCRSTSSACSLATHSK